MGKHDNTVYGLEHIKHQQQEEEKREIKDAFNTQSSSKDICELD